MRKVFDAVHLGRLYTFLSVQTGQRETLRSLPSLFETWGSRSSQLQLRCPRWTMTIAVKPFVWLTVREPVRGSPAL
jgi:hypothetical protein